MSFPKHTTGKLCGKLDQGDLTENYFLFKKKDMNNLILLFNKGHI